MAEKALANVTNASTTVGVRATNNSQALFNQAPTVRFPCQGYSMQAIGTNTGSVFICNTANPVISTGVGVLFEVPAPSGGSRPIISVDNPTAPVCFDLSRVFIVPAVSNEGVRVTAIVT